MGILCSQCGNISFPGWEYFVPTLGIKSWLLAFYTLLYKKNVNFCAVTMVLFNFAAKYAQK
jgi:hypothetical protein